MSRDDITRMANEAGLPEAWISDTGVLTWTDLERFAEIVRADERRAMMQLFTDPENQPTQHGTVTVEYMMREIADEREACAYKAGIALLGADRGLANRVDQAIRARGQA